MVNENDDKQDHIQEEQEWLGCDAKVEEFKDGKDDHVGDDNDAQGVGVAEGDEDDWHASAGCVFEEQLQDNVLLI